MLIIYHCYGGTHSSVTAASLHLNQLPDDPKVKDLLALPLFDKIRAAAWGRLFYHGNDENGNQIYSLGRGKHFNLIKAFFESLKTACNLNGFLDEIVFIDTFPCVNIKMRIGGFLSRYLGVVSLGRNLSAVGTLEALPKLRKAVFEAKSKYSRKK